MTIICKCRSCGGSIEYALGDSTGVCSACGAKQVIEPRDIYEQACSLAEDGTEDSLEQAMLLFRLVRDWQDADRQYINCRTRLGRMRWAVESTRLKEEEDRFETKLRRWRKIGVTVLTAVLLCIAMLTVVTLIPFVKYNRAAECFTAGEYERAAAAFQKMDGYRDSKVRVYLSAVELYKARRYEEALPYFIWLDGYLDHGYYLQKCQERLSSQDTAVPGGK